MVDPPDFDDPGPLPIRPASRVRRAASVAIVLLLVASMVFLAWISGRGEIVVRPVAEPTAGTVPTASATQLVASRLAVVDAAGRLRTMDAGGGSGVIYGSADVRYAFPAWSPDGTRIAAVGTDPDGAAVHVFAVPEARRTGETPGTHDPTVVYEAGDHPPFYLYWTPDGGRLTFLTSGPNGIALRVGAADAGMPVRILREASPMYWTFADGDRLLVHSGGEGPGSFIGEIGGDGSTTDPLGAEPGGFRVPARSNDGRYRAFVVPGTDTPERVVVEGSDGAGRHEVAVFGAAALGFDPTGGALAFIAPVEAGHDATLPVGPLRLVDAGSGAVRTLLAGAVVAFFWSPDGRTLAAMRLPSPGDDKVALARSATPAATEPGLTLDLLFIDRASGAIRARSAVHLGDTFVTQLLPYFDQYALSHRVWAPDSRAIALPLIAEDGTTGLVVIQSDGSGARRFADGDIGFWSP